MNETHGGCADYIKENYAEVRERLPQLEALHVLESSEHMDYLDDRSVHLVVTSPPYPMVEMWDNQFGGYEEMHDMIGRVMRECYRVLVEGGIMCINMGDATRSFERFQCYPNHAEVLVRGRELGFDTLVPIHWMKPTNKPNSFLGSGFLPPNAYITQDTEYILIFRKRGSRHEMDDVLRRASQYTKRERDVWFSQQWRVAGETQDGYAVFPREIPYRLIRMFSILGDTVVDPFAGTGTTLEVARSLGRSAIGYEVNDELEPYLEDSISDTSWDDILENFVKSEELPEFGSGEFVKNPNSLIPFIDSQK